MRTTLNYLKIDCKFVGRNMYAVEDRCNVCNDPKSITFQYDSIDPNYKRSFEVCEECHKQINGPLA